MQTLDLVFIETLLTHIYNMNIIAILASYNTWAANAIRPYSSFCIATLPLRISTFTFYELGSLKFLIRICLENDFGPLNTCKNVQKHVCTQPTCEEYGDVVLSKVMLSEV